MTKQNPKPQKYSGMTQARIPLHKLRNIIENLKLVQMGTQGHAWRSLTNIIEQLEDIRDRA